MDPDPRTAAPDPQTEEAEADALEHAIIAHIDSVFGTYRVVPAGGVSANSGQMVPPFVYKI